MSGELCAHILHSPGMAAAQKIQACMKMEDDLYNARTSAINTEEITETTKERTRWATRGWSVRLPWFSGSAGIRVLNRCSRASLFLKVQHVLTCNSAEFAR